MPGNELAQTFFETRFRRVSQELPRLRDIRVGEWDVAGLSRQPIHTGLRVQNALNRLDHSPERNGIRVAQVEDFVAAVVLKGRYDPIDDIADESVVARRVQTAQNWNRPAL